MNDPHPLAGVRVTGNNDAPFREALMKHRDSHCGRPGCVCGHDYGCYQGWIDDRPSSTSPCPLCRSDVVERLTSRSSDEPPAWMVAQVNAEYQAAAVTGLKACRDALLEARRKRAREPAYS